MQRSLILLSLCGTLVAAQVHAEASAANFTGPLITPNAAAPPAGAGNVEPYLIYVESHAYYDLDGTRHTQHPGSHQWLLAVPVSYGVTDRLNAQLTAGTLYNVSGRQHSDGTRQTDTTVKLQYMLVAPQANGLGTAVSVSYAHTFPTGSYDRLGNNPLNGGGDGASTDQLALYAQQRLVLANGHTMRLRGLLNWGPSPSRVTIEGVSSHGTSTGFVGSARLGRSLNAMVAAEYALDRHWALAMDVTWGHRRGSSVRGWECRSVDSCEAVAQLAASHWTYSVAPAVEYNFTHSLGLIAGAQISFAGHNSGAYIAPQVALNVDF
ncbi:hypothetical protein [Dyella sp. ASV21]|jgi:hypothetical protein|uniref:hypothetical protein n=1 Tax=Dyella sp. ASV21 TaxID=2795114 RepID=UPI0018EC60AC|nr:hypothetical protein [Dyella sp. ASV21]